MRALTPGLAAGAARDHLRAAWSGACTAFGIVHSAMVEAEWERLASRRKAAPFLHPAFFLATANWLAPRHRALFLSARDGTELGAMLPLLRDGGRLTALRSLHSPRYDVVGDAG